MRLTLWSFDSAQDDKVGQCCAVLKLDTEGASAARRAKVLELSASEERRQFFKFRKGVMRRHGRRTK
jgi:hypothetical protein